jgi:hypothetical protein
MAQPLTTNSYSRKKYYFMNFESRQQFDELGAAAYKEMLKKGDIAKWNNSADPDFVGTSDKRLLNSGEFQTYIEPKVLEKAIETFEELFATIDMGGAFDKSRLIITDDKRGIFDFGLASQGLYRLQEYYSKKLAEESPSEFFGKLPGLVPTEFVREDKLKQYWYKSPETSEEYLLELRQKGLTAILDKDKDTPLTEISGMVTTQNPTPGLKFSTTTKKSYVTFERKGGKARMVDLYMPQGGLQDITAEGMLARALPLMLAARYFEMAGIKTRISVNRSYSDGDYFTCFTIPVKDYGEDIDFNWLAINVADPRFFRWNMWKYMRGFLAKDFNRKYQDGWGSTVYGGRQMLEVGNRYKNWYFDEMQKGLQPELAVDRNLMLFGGLESPRNTIKGQTDEIKEEFFRILDVVDFQFNSPEKAAKRVYERLVEKEGYTVARYKRYVQNTMAAAYSFPDAGEYATEPERIDVLEQDFDIALDGMNNYLATLT